MLGNNTTHSNDITTAITILSSFFDIFALQYFTPCHQSAFMINVSQVSNYASNFAIIIKTASK